MKNQARRMKAILFPTVLGLVIVTGCVTKRIQSPAQREAFLESALRTDPSFPNEKEAKVTFFAHFGTVTNSSGVLHVIFMKEVLTGMLAPRGMSFLMFFDEKSNFIGKQACTAHPLWCESSYVFMFGLDDYNGERGNVWDLSKGFLNRSLITKPAYGSYELPTESGG
jgi:hypothetical protein